MDKNKISIESAREQLNIFYKEYDVDFNDLPEKQSAVMESASKSLLKAITKKRLEITEEPDGIKFIQYLKNGTVLKYKQPDAPSKRLLAKIAPEDHYGKIYILMGYLSGEGANAIESIKGPDLSLIEVIGTIFLMV